MADTSALANAASPRWTDGGFRNVHPVFPGLHDPSVPMPTFTEFLCGGERRHFHQLLDDAIFGGKRKDAVRL